MQQAQAQADSILHERGYVYGDLRTPNILIDRRNNLKLIDFNWCGRHKIDGESQSGEFTRYPLSISNVIKWPEGVGSLTAILPQHDLTMLERLSDSN